MSDPVTFTGVVGVERVAVGSKSERDAVVLTTADGAWLLRRPGASAYGVDPGFAALAGRTVTVTGTTGSGTLVVDAIDPAGTVAPDATGRPAGHASDDDGDRRDVR